MYLHGIEKAEVGIAFSVLSYEYSPYRVSGHNPHGQNPLGQKGVLT